MKKRSLLSFLIVALISSAMFFTTSCGEDDTEAPVITLNGDQVMTVDMGGVFEDPGATATDNDDKNPTVTASGEVDVTLAGEYTIVYTATDKDNNTSTKNRTVYVKMNPVNVEGNWRHTDDIGGTSYPAENETISKSAQNADRIYFSKFAGYTNLQPYAVLSGNDGRTVTIPQQTFSNVGTTNLTVVVVSDAVTISPNAGSFVITYTLDDGSGATSCTSTYQKL